MHAPALDIVGLRASDALPVGNGDGILSPGESYLLYATVKNYGSGLAGGLVATLTALDAGTAVAVGIAPYPDLGLLARAENAVGFQLSETNTAIENPLQLTLTDGAGRTIQRAVELRPPLPPVIQSFDATQGLDKIKVVWSGSPSSDVAGYRVYHSLSATGPFDAASPDVVAHTVFTDAGLDASTRYYYAVAAVDLPATRAPSRPSGRRRPIRRSCRAGPTRCRIVSANSPAVGDIDGDGYLEVVVGNDKVYAWHDGGDEVRDGDGLPATWGIFSTLGTDFVGPAALASIDGSPGLEIAAAAYTSKEVFIFDGAGGVLPGLAAAHRRPGARVCRARRRRRRRRSRGGGGRPGRIPVRVARERQRTHRRRRQPADQRRVQAAPRHQPVAVPAAFARGHRQRRQGRGHHRDPGQEAVRVQR